MDADELFTWLLEQDPHIVLQWIHEVLEGARQIPDRFNWLGLAEVAASFALNKGGRRSSPPDLDWAYIAVLVHNYIIHEDKEYGRFNSVCFYRKRLCNPLRDVPPDEVWVKLADEHTWGPCQSIPSRTKPPRIQSLFHCSRWSRNCSHKEARVWCIGANLI